MRAHGFFAEMACFASPRKPRALPGEPKRPPKSTGGGPREAQIPSRNRPKIRPTSQPGQSRPGQPSQASQPRPCQPSPPSSEFGSGLRVFNNQRLSRYTGSPRSLNINALKCHGHYKHTLLTQLVHHWSSLSALCCSSRVGGVRQSWRGEFKV